MGVGLWTPQGPRLTAAGAPPAPTDAVPASALLPPALRRRAGLLSRIVAEAVGQAASEGGADLRHTPIVYGSAYGETSAAVEMMGAFGEGEGLPSPITFHNSVHNAPAGYLSIATGCHAFSPSIAAGPETTAMALIEAACLLHHRGGDVIVALGDEPVPRPLGDTDAYPPGAVAFHLRVAPGRGARCRIGVPRRGPGQLPDLPSELAPHPCAPAFRLAWAVARTVRGTISLGTGEADGWSVSLEPAR